MSAFSPGRVSIWHTSLKSFSPAYDAMAKLGGTDVFFEATDPLLTKTVMAAAKTKTSSDGKSWRPQLALDGTHGDTGQALAITAIDRITTFRPGVLELDVESGDDNVLGVTVDKFLGEFRQGDPWRFAFPLCINVVPLKGYVLPIARMAQDPNCYVRVQRYYGGECRPAEPELCRDDIVGRGFPEERFSFMESAKARRLIDGTVFCDLPIFTDKGVQTRKLSRGAIFNANFLREAGLV